MIETIKKYRYVIIISASCTSIGAVHGYYTSELGYPLLRGIVSALIFVLFLAEVSYVVGEIVEYIIER